MKNVLLLVLLSTFWACQQDLPEPEPEVFFYTQLHGWLDRDSLATVILVNMCAETTTRVVTYGDEKVVLVIEPGKEKSFVGKLGEKYKVEKTSAENMLPSSSIPGPSDDNVKVEQEGNNFIIWVEHPVIVGNLVCVNKA